MGIENMKTAAEGTEFLDDSCLEMSETIMPELLPLGSVVTLKGGQKRIMIVGRMHKESATDRWFDYAAVLWPEGIIRSDRLFLFNQEDIRLIHFIGLQDVQEFSFRSQLEEKWKELSSLQKN